MISPPALALLTIGSFTTLYTSWVQYPRSTAEIPLCLSDLAVDLLVTGVGAFGVEWFYRNGLKVFAWTISLVPILLVVGVALLVILIRVRVEQSLVVRKTRKERVRVTKDQARKIHAIVSNLGRNSKN